MARAIMGGDFRAIKKAPAAASVDPRLALVDLFLGRPVQPDGTVDLTVPLPEGFIDLTSGEGPRYDYADLFIEDAQEPAGEPVAETGADGPVEAQTAVDEAPVQPEPEEKTEDPEPVAAEDDYDPIAAVLG